MPQRGPSSKRKTAYSQRKKFPASESCPPPVHSTRSPTTVVLPAHSTHHRAAPPRPLLEAIHGSTPARNAAPFGSRWLDGGIDSAIDCLQELDSSAGARGFPACRCAGRHHPRVRIKRRV